MCSNSVKSAIKTLKTHVTKRVVGCVETRELAYSIKVESLPKNTRLTSEKTTTTYLEAKIRGGKVEYDQMDTAIFGNMLLRIHTMYRDIFGNIGLLLRKVLGDICRLGKSYIILTKTSRIIRLRTYAYLNHKLNTLKSTHLQRLSGALLSVYNVARSSAKDTTNYPSLKKTFVLEGVILSI